MKRIVLFLLVELSILSILGLLGSLLGLKCDGVQPGLNLPSVLAVGTLLGVAGALVSLLLSRRLALRGTQAAPVVQPSSAAEAWLLATVERQARAAGVAVPVLAIFPSVVPNSFATGPTRNRALIAISQGVLDHLNQDEIEAVLGHEISHIASGDMVTLGLLQGVLNTFIFFPARAIGNVLDGSSRRGSAAAGPAFSAVSLALQLVPGLLATALVAWFSRSRELRADAGGAHLAGKRKMVAALEKLVTLEARSPLSGGLAAFGLTRGTGWLFATHPPLDGRLAALSGAGTAR